MKSIPALPKIEFVSFEKINEKRPVALVSSEPIWKIMKDRLRLPVVWQGEAVNAVEADWSGLLDDVAGEVVYAVGGGLVADAAKYIAGKKRLPLISLPTTLSVDAFFTWASGVRVDGCVSYIATKTPDKVVIDWKVIEDAPPEVRSAGVCDVLSIAVGKWDWQFAHKHHKNPADMPYSPTIANIAASILEETIDCAESAGKGEKKGLKRLLDCLLLQAQLCNQIGHARPEEGSEHYFAYCAENLVGSGRSHGELVGPGILIMAELQGQDVSPLKRALKACHVPLTNLSEDVIRKTLTNLPQYVRTHNLPFGIAHRIGETKQVRHLDIEKLLGPLP
ncbi:MAG: iron-containing alcohol dehydrogenase [Proteobacteria bacterium]|nr:iron-containing alcohol dehydrogenase [Pseudomonadota bacterium]